MDKSIDKKTKAIITEAVNDALQAGRAQASSIAKDAYKATEKRLHALPVLERKVISDKEMLEELVTEGPHGRSKSIVRFQRSGYRVSPEEMLEALINDLKAIIATDEHEIATVRRALEEFKEDPYFITVTGKYIDRYEDADIANKLGCSGVQVWKQRTRIVQSIAIMLYGADAV